MAIHNRGRLLICLVFGPILLPISGVCLFAISRFGHSHLVGFYVGLVVEVREEDEEDEGVGQDPPAKEDGIVAVLEEEQLGGMRYHKDKLEDLCRRHIPFPPQVGIELRTSSSQCVISVHPHVNKAVD